MSGTRKITVATTWLDGCSGCHMSFLDLDEQLFDLIDKIEVVYSPLVDAKHLPKSVDLGIVEGSVSSEEDLKKALEFRQRCKFLVSLGDCAVAGNVPAMRNLFDLEEVLDRAYLENVQHQPQRPTIDVPRLLDPVRPLHAVVKVDLYVQGCPPSAAAIGHVLNELIEGRVPTPTDVTRFGA